MSMNSIWIIVPREAAMNRSTWGYMRSNCRFPAWEITSAKRLERCESQGAAGTLMRFQALYGPYSEENLFYSG